MGVASGYEHVGQHQVDPTHHVDRVASLVQAPPHRRQSRPINVQDLAQYGSREEETLTPCVEAGTRPYEPIQTTRQADQLQSTRPRSIHFGHTEPDLQRLTLGQSEERIKLGKFNGKSDVGEFIADYLDISRHNRWSDSQALLQLRLALVGEAAVCKRGYNIDQILGDLRERFGETMKYSNRNYDVLQQGQLTLRQFGDKEE